MYYSPFQWKPEKAERLQPSQFTRNWDNSSQKYLTSRGFSQTGKWVLFQCSPSWNGRKLHTTMTAVRILKTWQFAAWASALSIYFFFEGWGKHLQLAIFVTLDTPSVSEIKWAKPESLQGFLLPIARYIRRKLRLHISTTSRPDLRPQLQSESLSWLQKKATSQPNCTANSAKKDICWFDGHAMVQSSLKSVQLVKKQGAVNILLTHFLKVACRLTVLISKYSSFEHCQVIITCHRHWNSIL